MRPRPPGSPTVTPFLARACIQRIRYPSTCTPRGFRGHKSSMPGRLVSRKPCGVQVETKKSRFNPAIFRPDACIARLSCTNRTSVYDLSRGSHGTRIGGRVFEIFHFSKMKNFTNLIHRRYGGDDTPCHRAFTVGKFVHSVYPTVHERRINL